MRRLEADTSSRRQALRGGSTQDSPRKRELLEALDQDLRAEKAALRQELKGRRRELRAQARRRGEDPYANAQLRALQAELDDQEMLLQEDMAFQRSARRRELEGCSLTPEEKDEELRCLEAAYSLRRLDLRDQFWRRRGDMLRARGRTDEFSP